MALPPPRELPTVLITRVEAIRFLLIHLDFSDSDFPMVERTLRHMLFEYGLFAPCQNPTRCRRSPPCDSLKICAQRARRTAPQQRTLLTPFQALLLAFAFELLDDDRTVRRVVATVQEHREALLDHFAWALKCLYLPSPGSRIPQARFAPHALASGRDARSQASSAPYELTLWPHLPDRRLWMPAIAGRYVPPRNRAFPIAPCVGTALLALDLHHPALAQILYNHLWVRAFHLEHDAARYERRRPQVWARVNPLRFEPDWLAKRLRQIWYA